MTEANQKILYEHFVATGQTKYAEDILRVYPHFKPEPISKPKEKTDGNRRTSNTSD